MHLVLSADNFVYETAPMSFNDVVKQVRDGQCHDVYRVLALTFIDGVGLAADVTRDVACAIFAESNEHPIRFGSDVYSFVERELSCVHAEECAWEDAAERYADRKRDLRRRETGGLDA